MARTRAFDYDDKRKALLAVAARLFAAHGFDRTSIAEIAAKARVSKALLYHYYPMKSALLYDIIREHLAYVADALAAADEPSAPPEGHLYGLVRATLFAYRDADALHKVQLNELGKLGEYEQRELRSLEREIVEIMARAVKRLNPKLFDSGEASLLKPATMSLFGVLNWAYLWCRDGGKLSREDYARFTTRLFIDGVARLKEAGEPAADVRLAKAEAEKA
ncbi:MAG TPA: TetR/AcrR family transcriptional regulator [Roseiarcus sp.]|nr:TetR/AcrR family transcriptional regulator [Roseiarcus sp.]